MNTTSLRLPDDLTRALDRLARERGTSRSEIVREAVREYVATRAESGVRDRVALARRMVTYPGSGRKDGGARSEEHLRKSFGGRRGDGSR